MAIAKMKLVNIISDQKNLNEVLLRFIDLDCFHPEPASKIVDHVHGLTTLQEENPFTEVIAYFKDMEVSMGIELENEMVKDPNYDLAGIRHYLDGVHAKYEQIMEVKKDLETVIQENKDALRQIENIEGVDISLDDIFSCKYVNVRFGRLPLDSVDKLQYYRNRPFIFKSFHEDSTYSWCMYFSTPKYEREVDNIFSSLYFERIRIPDFVHDTPSQAKENLQDEIANDYKQLAHVEERLSKLLSDCKATLGQIKGELIFLNKTFEARKYVVGLGERFTITGFAAEDDVESIKAVFKDLKEVEIEVRPAHSDKRLSPPTKLKNGWFARPFSMFVEMYGMPNYNDIDPTPFVALTYTLLFGIMFGDLGQGIVLSIVGYIAYKWKHMQLGEVGIRIGISSAFFGILYGSVFGNETLLNPLFTEVLGMEEKPFEVMTSGFIMPLLVAVIALGAVLILCSMCINLYVQFKHKDYGELLFSHNGVCGIIFYGSLLIGVALQLGLGIPVFNMIYIVCLLVIPFLLMFCKEPLTHWMQHKRLFPEGFGGFFMQSFFELFEVCLSYLTNTISYLRVGGFVLSHAGMMLVVTLLMDMAGGASIIVAILGNIFVMCLEGMIVGIQILRLEFYEMFSRYFTGDGIAFKSLKNN